MVCVVCFTCVSGMCVGYVVCFTCVSGMCVGCVMCVLPVCLVCVWCLMFSQLALLAVACGDTSAYITYIAYITI